MHSLHIAHHSTSPWAYGIIDKSCGGIGVNALNQKLLITSATWYYCNISALLFWLWHGIHLLSSQPAKLLIMTMIIIAIYFSHTFQLPPSPLPTWLPNKEEKQRECDRQQQRNADPDDARHSIALSVRFFINGLFCSPRERWWRY